MRNTFHNGHLNLNYDDYGEDKVVMQLRLSRFCFSKVMDSFEKFVSLWIAFRFFFATQKRVIVAMSLQF